MFPMPFISITDKIQNLTFNTDGWSATASMVHPPCQKGDVLIWFDTAYNTVDAPPTKVVPAMFTEVLSGTSAVPSPRGIFVVGHRIADGTEGGTTVNGMSGPGGQYKTVLVFRGDSISTGISVQSTSWEFHDGDPNPRTVTCSLGTPVMLVVGWTWTPNGFTPIYDGYTGHNGWYSSYKSWNVGSTPVNTTQDAYDGGNENLNVMVCWEVR